MWTPPASAGVFGPESLDVEVRPNSGSEDFGQLLQKIPGCYLNIGNGDTAALHNLAYDFNDKAIPYGVRFLVAVAQGRLACALWREEFTY